MSRTALVIGVSGQDGSLLAQRLLAEGTVVHGTSRDAAGNPFANLVRLGLRGRVALHTCRPEDCDAVRRLIETVAPDEIYNVSAQSSVGQSFAAPRETIDSILGATVAVLDAIRTIGAPASRAAAIARALLPVSSSTSAEGPTNVIPASTHARANSGFSDMNP